MLALVLNTAISGQGYQLIRQNTSLLHPAIIMVTSGVSSILHFVYDSVILNMQRSGNGSTPEKKVYDINVRNKVLILNNKNKNN